MAKKYLMRLGKTPFDPVGGFDTLERNTIGGNNGNLIFGYGAHKLFSTESTEIDANHYQINKKMADKVNEQYDGFILPLANAFRPSFEEELKRTTEFIRCLKIPFIMLSGGAQLPLDGDPSELKKIEHTVKRFASAVLDKSSAITVRGALTAEYLESLGFKDVIVVGCPSMTLNGPDFRVNPPNGIHENSPIAYNIQPGKLFAGHLFADAENKYAAIYMPQNGKDLEMMLWATQPYQDYDDRFPLTLSHRQFADGAAEYNLDATTWIKRMQRLRFSFGPRIHGNIAAVLAGTPAVVLAHDGRTLELAQYHGIPYVRRDDKRFPKTIQELYEWTDFTEFNHGLRERFNRLSDFIHKNGFNHVYDSHQSAARRRYQEKLDNIRLPKPQTTAWAVNDSCTSHTKRISHLREGYNRSRQTERKLKKELASIRQRLDKIETLESELKDLRTLMFRRTSVRTRVTAYVHRLSRRVLRN